MLTRVGPATSIAGPPSWRTTAQRQLDVLGLAGGLEPLLVAFDGIVKETVAEGRVAELDSRDGALLGRAGELERSPEQVDRVRVPSALRRRSELKGDDGLELLPRWLYDRAVQIP
jgi:hypothetical protein